MDISEDLKLKMQNFTHLIRDGNTDDQTIKVYRDFIVGNIYGVIQNTYPYFDFYADEKLKSMLIEYFLQKNKSFDPAFHQIATEILSCSKEITMSEALRKLIEFEWLIFDTEIANCVIDANSELSTNINYKDIAAIEFNPSLTIVALPFDISNLGKVPILEDKETLFYCIYRNINHRVIFQKLNQLEYVLINSLSNIGIATFGIDDFQKIDNNSKDKLLQSMHIWHAKNIIKIIT